MSAIEVTGISFEEFLSRYDGKHAEWLPSGEVILMSPASDRHQDLVSFLDGLLRVFVESRHLGIIRPAPLAMRLDPDRPGREPDLIFLAREHLDRLRPAHLAGPADLIVEIISPESRARDRGEKFYEYEAGGVPELWMLDPIREQAEFYHLGDDGIYRLIPIEDGMFRSRVLDGLWLRTAWLWQHPLPPVLEVLREWKLV